MCGISGVFRIGPVIHDPNSDLNFELQNECNILNSYNGLRGPDHTSLLFFPNCALGHTRLAIRDLSNRSNQPVTTDNGYVFSFNGEIYAHSGPSLPSLSLFDSDTLWLKRIIEIAGLPNFRLIHGDFACAFYNRTDHQLVLVRDHFGKKPLYYSFQNSKLSFSSSLSGLAHILSRTTINQISLSEYLVYGNSFSDRSIYNEIYSVPPGCLLSIDLFSGKVSTFNYYSYSPTQSSGAYTYKTRRQALEDFHILLSSVVQSHLVSDVTISSLLSGGIDSKSITYCASQYSSINAYTARFVGSSSEDLQASTFSSLYSNINHTSVSVSSDNLISSIKDFSCFVGEPFADASVFSLISLYKSLPSSNRVVLQGDGGDELFGGYSRYKRFPFYSRIPNSIPRLLLSLFPNLHPRLQRVLNLSALTDGNLYAQLMTMDIPQSCLLPLFNSLEDLSFSDILDSFSSDFPTTCSSTDSKLSLLDFSHQLPSQFLYKVDRASMFVSKEARIPFIDSRITDFLSCIPPSVRFRRFPEKSFLRNSLPIPTSHSSTPKKGFSTPYHLWICDHFDIINDYLYSDRFLSAFGICHAKLSSFLDHRSDKYLYSFQVWKLFNLSVWFHHVFI
tara:strand:- start:4937 stop:6784 length:1848 start_codon:yes stop_codon:yes gene_type:complete